MNSPHHSKPDDDLEDDEDDFDDEDEEEFDEDGEDDEEDDDEPETWQVKSPVSPCKQAPPSLDFRC
jgi:hypothetical protein